MNINADLSKVSQQMPKASVPSKPSLTAVPLPTGQSASVEESIAIENSQQQVTAAEIIKQSQEQLDQVMSQIDEYVQKYNYRLSLNVDQRTNRTVAKIIDKESGEVIKEIPPQELLDLAAKLKEAVQGIMLDTVS